MGKFFHDDLPGEELINKGLKDLSNGVESIESLLVLIGRPRLNRLNVAIPPHDSFEFPETRLYRLLSKKDPNDAHARMNAYIRRLVSFEQSLELLSCHPNPVSKSVSKKPQFG